MARIGAHEGQLLSLRQIADFVEENLFYFKLTNLTKI